jgi:hypothetical protein
MILVLLEIRSRSAQTGRPSASLAKVWVDAADAVEAERRARAQVEADGHEVLAVMDIEATDESDYFPPCNSLDALRQARVTGVRALYS